MLLSATFHGNSCARWQGRIWFRRAKTTADTWLGGSPDFLSPEKCSYCWCVCVCVCSILWKLFIQTLFNLLGKEQNDLLRLGDFSLLLLSEEILLDSFPSVVYSEEVWWEESEVSTFSSRALQPACPLDSLCSPLALRFSGLRGHLVAVRGLCGVFEFSEQELCTLLKCPWCGPLAPAG